MFDRKAKVPNRVNDIQSDALESGSFALVVPVPEVITKGDTANVLEPEVFDRLDAYSQPRLVRVIVHILKLMKMTFLMEAVEPQEVLKNQMQEESKSKPTL